MHVLVRIFPSITTYKLEKLGDMTISISKFAQLKVISGMLNVYLWVSRLSGFIVPHWNTKQRKAVTLHRYALFVLLLFIHSHKCGCLQKSPISPLLRQRSICKIRSNHLEHASDCIPVNCTECTIQIKDFQLMPQEPYLAVISFSARQGRMQTWQPSQTKCD